MITSSHLCHSFCPSGCWNFTFLLHFHQQRWDTFLTAAHVIFNASSSRSFFSFISGSVVAPILITATPPSNFRDVLEAFLYRNQNLSLNQGAFTAHTFSVPRILLTTKVANASSSTSSDIIINGLPDCAIGANITEN